MDPILADDRPQRAGAGDGGHVPRPPVPGPDPAQPARRHGQQEERRGRRRLRLLMGRRVGELISLFLSSIAIGLEFPRLVASQSFLCCIFNISEI